MSRHTIAAFLLILQGIQLAFLLLHDWISLGRLTNLPAVHAADSRARLFWTTILSALPFAAVFIASCIYFPHPHWPMWLRMSLWYTYGFALLGAILAWWWPYLGPPNPERTARYTVRFAGTHRFLPERNGIAPDTLHVLFHATILATLILLALL